MSDSVEYIDVTPTGLKTPEGVKRVNEALTKFHDANADVANAATQFLRQWIGSDTTAKHGPVTIQLNPEALDDLADVWERITERERVQDVFLRAVAGR